MLESVRNLPLDLTVLFSHDVNVAVPMIKNKSEFARMQRESHLISPALQLLHMNILACNSTGRQCWLAFLEWAADFGHGKDLASYI